MTNPEVCRYGEWLWRRVSKDGVFYHNRYTHYWIHIFWCPVCRWKLALDTRMMYPHRVTVTKKEHYDTIKENWRQLGFDWNPDRVK